MFVSIMLKIRAFFRTLNRLGFTPRVHIKKIKCSRVLSKRSEPLPIVFIFIYYPHIRFIDQPYHNIYDCTFLLLDYIDSFMSGIYTQRFTKALNTDALTSFRVFAIIQRKCDNIRGQLYTVSTV